ncbi:hypothetical protein BGZ46_004183 [Entomortierella lignicola]|nr:hypothetical protein BGZ46_004183 [Entomortierella lignicola]
MFSAEEHNAEVYGTEGHKSHELLRAEAASHAMKMYQEQHTDGNHTRNKEILIGITGAAIDRLIETRGLDGIDPRKVKHEAKKNAEGIYNEKYVN